MIRSFFVSIILLAAATPAYAGVVINEVAWMGTAESSYCEWVELYNDGSGEIDLSGWKLYEAGSTGDVLIVSLTKTIPAGGYYLIERVTNSCPDPISGVDDDAGSFGGSGLNNNGETLVLKDSNGSNIDTLDGSSGWAGGNSSTKETMQKISSGWGTGAATPKVENIQGEIPPPPAPAPVASLEEGEGVTMAESTSKIKADAGEDRTVLAGAEVGFSASAEGFTEDSINNARFSWNFGDGYIGEGKNAAHVFIYPGIYSVLLNVLFSGNSASDSTKITVVENPVVISEIKPGSFLEIYNNSPRKIDFSGFGIGLGDSKPFYFPAGTFLQPYAHLALNGEILGFQLAQNGTIKLFYPNHKILFSSVYPQLLLGDAESLNFADGHWFRAKATPGAKNNAPAKSKTTQATNGPQTKVAENPKPNSEIAAASVINIEHSNGWGKLLKENYFWLFMGLGAGILAGLGAILGKRYLA